MPSDAALFVVLNTILNRRAVTDGDYVDYCEGVPMLKD